MNPHYLHGLNVTTWFCAEPILLWLALGVEVLSDLVDGTANKERGSTWGAVLCIENGGAVYNVLP